MSLLKCALVLVPVLDERSGIVCLPRIYFGLPQSEDGTLITKPIVLRDDGHGQENFSVI